MPWTEKRDDYMDAYATAVALVRWQEAEGAIDPATAFRVLNEYPAAYRAYVVGRLPSGLGSRFTLEFSPDKVLQATERMKRQLTELCPGAAQDIARTIARDATSDRGK